MWKRSTVVPLALPVMDDPYYRSRRARNSETRPAGHIISLWPIALGARVLRARNVEHGLLFDRSRNLAYINQGSSGFQYAPEPHNERTAGIDGVPFTVIVHMPFSNKWKIRLAANRRTQYVTTGLSPLTPKMMVPRIAENLFCATPPTSTS
jgi:hypothetical protein